MKLINPSYEILEQGEGLQGIYEQIERVGKTCYKSEVKGGESAKKFVEKMIANQHYAMLEHGTVYLKSDGIVHAFGRGYQGGMKYLNNPYSRVNIEGTTQYVTTNLRVLVENDWMDDLKYYLCEPTQQHVKRVCVKFICDRGVSHELVRHRVFSFAQESTRYCNYSKDKFGNELTFIKPCWFSSSLVDDTGHWDANTFYRMPSQPIVESAFLGTLQSVERAYFDLLKCGWKPQEARAVLPNALKTEICMTGFVDDTGWKHFFDLRALDKTGPAHPDMKALALPLYTDFIQRGLINPQ